MEEYDPSKETISQFLNRKNDSDEKETEEDLKDKPKELIINDGKIDFDPEDSINFNPGKDIAAHFGLKPEEIDAFSNISEKLFKLEQAQVVYNKSITDQIVQGGRNVTVTPAIKLWESYLDKLVDIKMLSFLCDLVELDQKVKDSIVEKEVSKKFLPLQPKKKEDNSINIEELSNQLNHISMMVSKRSKQ